MRGENLWNRSKMSSYKVLGQLFQSVFQGKAIGCGRPNQQDAYLQENNRWDASHFVFSPTVAYKFVKLLSCTVIRQWQRSA